MDTLEMIVTEEEAPQSTNRIRLVIDEDDAVPFVRFKPFAYEHKLEAIALTQRFIKGEAGEEDDIKFMVKMVAEWDLLDAETGQPLPVGEYLRLTTVQIAQLQAAWSEYQEILGEQVKKTRKRP